MSPPPVNKIEADVFVPEDYAYFSFGGTLRKLVYLPFSKVGSGVGTIDLLRQLPHHASTRSIDKLCELQEVLIHHLPTSSPRVGVGSEPISASA